MYFFDGDPWYVSTAVFETMTHDGEMDMEKTAQRLAMIDDWDD